MAAEASELYHSAEPPALFTTLDFINLSFALSDTDFVLMALEMRPAHGGPSTERTHEVQDLLVHALRARDMPAVRRALLNYEPTVTLITAIELAHTPTSAWVRLSRRGRVSLNRPAQVAAPIVGALSSLVAE